MDGAKDNGRAGMTSRHTSTHQRCTAPLGRVLPSLGEILGGGVIDTALFLLILLQGTFLTCFGSHSIRKAGSRIYTLSSLLQALNRASVTQVTLGRRGGSWRNC